MKEEEWEWEETEEGERTESAGNLFGTAEYKSFYNFFFCWCSLPFFGLDLYFCGEILGDRGISWRIGLFAFGVEPTILLYGNSIVTRFFFSTVPLHTHQPREKVMAFALRHKQSEQDGVFVVSCIQSLVA